MEFREGLKTIYIVGKGTTWSHCPSIYDREHGDDEEVWGVGTVFRSHRNCDRLFLMHDFRQEIVFEDRRFTENLKAYGKPFYTNTTYDKQMQSFPVERVMESYNRHYFINTVAWMLALVGTCCPEKVSIFGVDYADEDSQRVERAGVEFWLGVLMERGIEIEIHPSSTLMRTEEQPDIIYGYIPLKKRNGLIKEYMPKFLDGTKPQILERYKLVPVNYEEAKDANVQ